MTQDHDIRISDVRCVHAGGKDIANGLLAFVSFRLGDSLLVDGVCVRRTRDNRIVLSWPCRMDGAGRRHPILRPLDDQARQRLERRILKTLAEIQPGVAP